MTAEHTLSEKPSSEKERMHALALRTAQRIEGQAAAVRKLQEAEGETAREIRDNPDDGGNDVLRDFMAARALLDLPATFAECADEDIADGVEEWLDEMRCDGALSIRRRGYNDGDGWECDEVVIVLGTGGPHVQVEYEGTTATVRAYGWFKDGETTLPVDADAVDLLYGVDELYRDFA